MAAYDVFARFYDLFTENVAYSERAEYFDKIITSTVGEQGLLLDLACGTGSLSVALAKRGYEVIAVDASAGMLSLAQQKAFENEVDILFLNQRMESLNLYGSVSACVCALDSLNHLPNLRVLERVFARVALFLDVGGVFVFDMNTPFKHQNILANNAFVFEKDDVFCVWQNETNDLKTDISLDFFEKTNGQGYLRQTEQFSEQAFLLEDVLALLKKNGLELASLYGDDSFSAPLPTAQRWIFIAKKER